MVTIRKDGEFKLEREFVGLSTDDKPTNCHNGNTFYEMDTGITYYYNQDASGWLNRSATDNLASISVTTPPTKTSYVEGQAFDKTGMAVTATYGSGQSATTKTVTDNCVIDSNALKTTDTSVNISFADTGLVKTTTQSITVVARAISSISVKTAPTKTEYTPEDNILDMTGIVILATYNDESTEDIPFGTEGLTFSPANGSTVTESGNVTITYASKTCTQAITYVTLSSIAVTTEPTKTTYSVGETFDPTGMVITATYSNETTEVVEEYTYSPTVELTAEDTEITITYEDKTCTQSITVA